ncbi:RNA polymerase sigma factor, partial [Streptomyces graminilatus]|uniref:RNA polymerase sigma factor n=1 Tax=Streptomyces graminilatus TaxID=1464070 RepID=UPI003BAF97F7
MRHRGDLVRFASRILGDEGYTAHDLVQETFQAAAMQWTTLRDYDTGGQRAWLYRVLKNKVFDQWGATRGSCRADAFSGCEMSDAPRRPIGTVTLAD